MAQLSNYSKEYTVENQNQTQTINPSLLVLSYKHPVPFPGDNGHYPKHTVLEISLKSNIV